MQRSPGEPQHEPADAPRSWRASRTTRLIASGVGLALFAAAVWVVASRWTDFASALREATHARWWTLPALVILPWISCALATGMYHQLLNRDDPAAPRVRYGEGLAVIACTWLMNYLPARPGMFGRLAYHKIVNHMPLRHSISMSIVAVTCAGVSVALLVLVALSVHALQGAPIAIAFALPLPAVLMVVAGLLTRSRELPRRYLFACAIRYIDDTPESANGPIPSSISDFTEVTADPNTTTFSWRRRRFAWKR